MKGLPSRTGLLPKAFLLAYEPLNDGSRLSYDIRNFQTGLGKAPVEHPFHDMVHSMLSKAVKTQMENSRPFNLTGTRSVPYIFKRI